MRVNSGGCRRVVENGPCHVVVHVCAVIRAVRDDPDAGVGFAKSGFPATRLVEKTGTGGPHVHLTVGGDADVPHGPPMLR